jgi:hypothetical protein
VDRIFHDVVAEVVGLAVDVAALDAGAGQPHAKIPRMVIATVVVFGRRALGIDGPPELASPNDQRALE